MRDSIRIYLPDQRQRSSVAITSPLFYPSKLQKKCLKKKEKKKGKKEKKCNNALVCTHKSAYTLRISSSSSSSFSFIFFTSSSFPGIAFYLLFFLSLSLTLSLFSPSPASLILFPACLLGEVVKSLPIYSYLQWRRTDTYSTTAASSRVQQRGNLKF